MRELVLMFMVAVGLVASTSLAAAEQSADDASEPGSIYVSDIEIEGLGRTRRHVVERELLFEAGDETSREAVEESVQRLRNMGLFRTAEYRVRSGSDEAGADGHVVTLELDERWTTLPIVSFSSSGGVTNLLLGVFETNLLGRYLEVGLRYNRFGPTNSFVGWFYDRRFLDQRLFAGGELWWTNRQRLYYDADGELVDGYLNHRRKVRMGVEREWARWLSTGLDVFLITDDFTAELLPADLAQTADQRALPASSRAIPAEIGATVGRIDHDSYLRHGVAYTQKLAHSNTLWGATSQWTRWTHDVLAFARLPWRQNLAMRLGAGATSAAHPEYQFFVGGFDRVRGFVDSRFRGPYYWVANLEYRIASVDTRWFALQHTAFTDLAATSGRLGALSPSGASSGIGLRLISPKVNRLVIRVDYGWTWIDHGRAPLSFGIGQFF